MPVTINVGLAKKIGLRDYGSLGASCNVAFEADHSLLESDLAAFHQRVKNAFVACHQAIQDELARQQHEAAGPTAKGNGHAEDNGNGRHNGNGNGNGNAVTRRSNGRRATASQVRALHAIATRQGLDLPAELHQRYGVDVAEDLSISEASECIDAFKPSASNNHGGGR